MVNSINKGKRGEREVANLLAQIYPDALRGYQFRGGHESSDIVGTPWHVEVKVGKRPNILAAMEQAIEDSGIELGPWSAHGGTVEPLPPLVWTRKDRGEWLVTMRAKDWLRIVMNGPPRDNREGP